MNMSSLIVDWHARELQADYGLSGARMAMGCPLWRDDFVDDFLGYCLPSLLANQLEDCAIVLYVDGPAEERLRDIPVIRHLHLQIRRLPDELVRGLYDDGGQKYPLLAAAHNLLIHKAGEVGAGFHMLVADAVYSDRYFENLAYLTQLHEAIAHTGFAIVSGTGLPLLAAFTRDNKLVVSAASLGQIGWEHLNPQWASWTMDGITDFNEMPNSHYIHWRGRDHVRIHCAHQSAAWIGPDRCRKVTPGLGGTIDSELPRYMAGDFYQPVLADEMTYVVIAGATEPTPRVPFAEFKAEFWRFIGDNRAFLPYFLAPCVVPVPLEESAPDDAELDERMVHLMARLEGRDG